MTKENEKLKKLLTMAVINAFARKHTVLRYENKVICGDKNRLGGLGQKFADKEWRCKRCVLLDIRDGYYDYDDYCPVSVDLDVHGRGNIR